MSRLTRTTFAPHQNTAFRLAGDAEGTPSIDLELIEVTDKTPANFEGEQFSLIFKGPPDAPLYQQTYALAHDDMGEVSLFLVPVGQQDDGLLYEAFFNLAAEAA
jgi:hypothetical protein